MEPFVVDVEGSLGHLGKVPLSNVHPKTQCSGQYCTVHNPSKHHMRKWPMVWRNDKGVMERKCEHGVGHPDPDDAEHLKRVDRESATIHGCDGCCRD